ncbi:hypothetical protein RHGRI_033218 [Rhododendron griersonianum]|uniref:Hydroxyproline-rich glycoprotein family protein n=1 Tax=Rhododendron griersonianum TaxID=479676 RepID=A0AAV6HZ69_9ERIC|nr:hypothetical protein RHGRI_033218 [Rhododendron griersonianum]
MRNSLKKLRGGLGLIRHGDARDRRERRLQRSAAQLDDLARASQDMADMVDCYDSLFSSAAATTNSAYEFSESLREMGSCLLEKTALNDDEESGEVLLKLGKLQFEIQKLLDTYRAHMVRTISIPSESLLNELRTVEEMKRHCDEKRSVYEYVLQKYREKGRSKSSKGENYSSQDVKAAHDDFDQEATMFLCFFKKAFKMLEAVEPHVQLVTERQHIDYQFSGLEDNDSDNDDSSDEDDDEDDRDYNVKDDGELSFDYGKNDKGQNVIATPRSSMEVDSVESVDLTFPQVATVDAAKESQVRNHGRDSFASIGELKASSQSAPLSAEKKFDPAERFRQLRPLSSRKYHSYVLPTPGEAKGPVSSRPDTQTPRTRYASLSGPLEQKKGEKILGNEKLSGSTVSSQDSVLRESNNNRNSTVLPPPLTEELSSKKHDQSVTSDAKKIRRYAFSGPLTGKSWPNHHGLSASGPIASTGPPMLFSGPILRTPMPPPVSSPPKLSPNASPTFVSSPKISELHELPRPPANNKAPKFASGPLNKIGYSGPLVSNRQENPSANILVSSRASPLPTPPQTFPRSFSIPSRGQSGNISVSAPLGAPQPLKMAEEIESPTLTPISLSNSQPESTDS